MIHSVMSGVMGCFRSVWGVCCRASRANSRAGTKPVDHAARGWRLQHPSLSACECICTCAWRSAVAAVCTRPSHPPPFPPGPSLLTAILLRPLSCNAPPSPDPPDPHQSQPHTYIQTHRPEAPVHAHLQCCLQVLGSGGDNALAANTNRDVVKQGL